MIAGCRNALTFICVLLATGIVVTAEAGLTEFWKRRNDKPLINIFMDANHAPFLHGVSSGDPLPDAIIIWTRVTPKQSELGTEIIVRWSMWDQVTSTEAQPLVNGTAFADPNRDYTVKIDVTGLPETNQTYFYRFYYGNESQSRLGRTRTAPVQNANGGTLTFGITSCSQHQLYQNTFAHLAFNMSIGSERPESQRYGFVRKPSDESSVEFEQKMLSGEAINAMLDLGDFVYDTNEKTTDQRTWEGSCDYDYPNGVPPGARPVENRESLLEPAFVTFPMGFAMNCSWPRNERDEYMYRHSLNRMDPDLRAALAAHPWIHMIDSHDTERQGNTFIENDGYNQGLEVFEWWTPTRWEKRGSRLILYRVFHFGALAKVVALETTGSGESSSFRRWNKEVTLACWYTYERNKEAVEPA